MLDALTSLANDCYERMIHLPEMEENEVKGVATMVARKLLLSTEGITSEFLTHTITFKWLRGIKDFKRVIYLVAIVLDENGGRRLFRIEGEIHASLSMEECLRATISSFLRDLLGRPDVTSL